MSDRLDWRDTVTDPPTGEPHRRVLVRDVNDGYVSVWPAAHVDGVVTHWCEFPPPDADLHPDDCRVIEDAIASTAYYDVEASAS